MNQQIFIVDAFTDVPFKGNPAGVQLVEQPPEAARMQSIARELNFSETAFVCPEQDSNDSAECFSIRYFSPVMEIPLCGHATLASAKVLFDLGHKSPIQFRTIEDRLLMVKQLGDRLEMRFPLYQLQPATPPTPLLQALGIDQSLHTGFNHETGILMVEIGCHQQLVNLKPDYRALLDSHDSINGVCITARGPDPFDFYSRFFWPWSGGHEDPVTGATHTFLTRYWSEKLNKKVMNSFQASPRTGQMEVEVVDDQQFLIRGQAVILVAGHLRI